MNAEYDDESFLDMAVLVDAGTNIRPQRVIYDKTLPWLHHDLTRFRIVPVPLLDALVEECLKNGVSVRILRGSDIGDEGLGDPEAFEKYADKVEIIGARLA